MANLYRKKTTVIDPETGRKVAQYSKKWWGRYRDENDRLRRVSLSTSKAAARKMLTDILEQVERRRAGIEDPVVEESCRPIERHIEDYEKHLEAKNDSPKHIKGTITKVRRFCKEKRLQYVHQIKMSDVEGFLVDLRKMHGLSIKTSNHYLRAIKSFVRWLVINRRLQRNPLEGLSLLNEATDRRRERRSLSSEEFARIYRVAQTGPPVVGFTGPDRAMLYMLAAWTGLRRGELGSLTVRSFDLDATPPTAIVAAAYSKHRRKDVVYLHEEVVAALRDWLALRSPEPGEILFPVSEVTCGTERATSKMIKRDMAIARDIWLEEAETEEKRLEREKSDFLKYIDSEGRYADFHALRHTFVTNLARADISPKVAQTLARHSDIRLTMDIYTHVDREQQVAAIESLPALIQ